MRAVDKMKEYLLEKAEEQELNAKSFGSEFGRTLADGQNLAYKHSLDMLDMFDRLEKEENKLKNLTP